MLKPKKNIAICAIIKNEKPAYISEWINWHLLVGIKEIHIYNNGNSINIAHSKVNIYKFPGRAVQLAAYQDFIKRFSKYYNYCAFIDVDEFIVPSTPPYDLNYFMTEYSQFGGLAINWIMFGMGDEKNKSQIKKSLMSSPNSHVKCIVKLDDVIRPLTPHSWGFKNNKYCVNELKNKVLGSYSRPLYSKIQLNHYFYRSLPELRQKIKRGRGDTVNPRRIEEVLKWYNGFKRKQKYNYTIFRVLAAKLGITIKEAMKVDLSITTPTKSLEHQLLGS